jgi:hypothetical protein
MRNTINKLTCKINEIEMDLNHLNLLIEELEEEAGLFMNEDIRMMRIFIIF